jgi:hypothetical protein
MSRVALFICSEQCPPSMLMALMLYSYASGVFGSRRSRKWKELQREKVSLQWTWVSIA